MLLIDIIQGIVQEAIALRDSFPESRWARVNYACIFCQSSLEYDEFLNDAHSLWKELLETSSGFLFNLTNPIQTVAGKLKIIKIRKPDITRPERWDADFTLTDYNKFKDIYLHESGFSLIQRLNMEMIEFMKDSASVRVYYSHRTLEELYWIQ